MKSRTSQLHGRAYDTYVTEGLNAGLPGISPWGAEDDPLVRVLTTR